jgi:integrase/recombinase XerD
MLMRFVDAIEGYLRDQRQAGRINSEETVRCCRRVLGLHAGDTPDGPLGSSREDVKRTLARWEHPNTRAREHSILVSFYDWMLTEGHRKDNPARQVARTKMRKASVYRLTRMEVEAMIAACETERQRWVILLGVCTGARTAELMEFQGRHFAREGFVWFSEDIAKGAKERWVPVLPELAPVVAEIRASVRADHHVVATYQTCTGVQRPRTCRISHTSLIRIVREVAQRAGITARVYPHLLRHAFGDHVAKHAGLRVAQALLGHASVQTTASVYVERAGLDEMAASVRELRYGESQAERRARFAAQMRACGGCVSPTPTGALSSPPHVHAAALDMSGRDVVRYVLAR